MSCRNDLRLQSRDLRQRFLPLLVKIAVARVMLTALIESQVDRPIISADSIFMVDRFVGQHGSADHARHHDVMLQDLFTRLRFANCVHDIEPVVQMFWQHPTRDAHVTIAILMRAVSDALHGSQRRAAITTRSEFTSTDGGSKNTRRLPSHVAAVWTGHFDVDALTATAARREDLHDGVVNTKRRQIRTDFWPKPRTVSVAATREGAPADVIGGRFCVNAARLHASRTIGVDKPITLGCPINLWMRRVRPHCRPKSAAMFSTKASERASADVASSRSAIDTSRHLTHGARRLHEAMLQCGPVHLWVRRAGIGFQGDVL